MLSWQSGTKGQGRDSSEGSNRQTNPTNREIVRVAVVTTQKLIEMNTNTNTSSKLRNHYRRSENNCLAVWFLIFASICVVVVVVVQH